MKLKATHCMVLLAGLLVVAIDLKATDIGSKADTSSNEDTLYQHICYHTFVLTGEITPCLQTEVSKVNTQANVRRPKPMFERTDWSSLSSEDINMKIPKNEPNSYRVLRQEFEKDMGSTLQFNQYRVWNLNQTGLGQFNHGSSSRARRSYRVIGSQ